VWPNEADFDPATLHDWDRVGEALIEMAHSWEEPKQLDGSRRTDCKDHALIATTQELP